MFKLTLKLISVVLFVPLLSFAQQQTIDSLFNVIKKSKQDTHLVNVYNDLTHELIYSDSKKADSIVGLSINLSSSLGYKKGLAWAKYLHALNKRNNSEYGLSLQLFKESEKLFVELNDSINIGSVEQNKGSIYRNLGDYKKATEYYLNSLKIRENIKDKDGIAASLGGLGLVYDDQGDMDKALHYYGEALKIKTELNDQKGIAALYNNIGQAYETQKKYSEALLYLQKSLRIKEKINNRNGIASTLDNIGSIYLALKKYPEAIKYFERSLAIERDMNNQQGICISIYNIGLAKFQQGKTEEASAKFMAAEKIAIKYKLKPQLNEIYKSMVDVYVKELDYVSAFNYQKKVIKLTNEMTGEEIAEKIIEMQQKYEVEKTQKEIEILKKEKDLQDKELKTNKKILYIVSISSFILLLFLSYAVHAFLAKKKINKKLSELNTEIENSNKKLSETNENLSKLNKKITLQRDTIEHQHLQLEEKNKDITNSINYAQRLQTAILPPKEFITHLFGKHFIFFQPKDVLSGDFYWFDALEGRVYFAVIDCTGHGVPGAFLSLVAFNLLKHAIHEHGKEKPADILRQVNKDLFDTLNQKNSSLHVQDGMDISLCCYNIHTNQLDYAGANSSIYLIRKDKNEQHVLYEIKADKESIGKSSAEKQFAFTNQIIDIQVNDKLFLFTDGFTDQFGGDLGKKYKHKQLQELLVNNADKPINNMQSILEKEFTSWKKNNEQVDDVLIVGVEF